jgi:pyruvate formate lyase activating enzyme
MKKALLYEQLSDNLVRCNLCNHRCVIADGKLGVCKVRKNVGGVLFTLVYGHTISQHVDPIEKKPLYHFYPGSTTYSIATRGCNFHCQWCQNWEIVMATEEISALRGSDATPGQIVAAAVANGSRSIAYTYTEPTVFMEYAYDIAKLAHQKGLANIYVTNGYMTPEMLAIFSPNLDAANVDLKSFRDKTYHRYVGGSLQPILDNMKTMKEMGVWLEVTTMVIPGINDSADEFRDAARFIAQELGPDTPWHLSRFFPNYKMANLLPTSIFTLHKARDIGLEEGLRYVYLGNVTGKSTTTCHNCGSTLIQRRGFWLDDNHIQAGYCPYCGTPIAGVWT